MLEMACFGNAITMRHNDTLAFQPVGACIASPLCRRCFPVRVSIGVKRLERQLRTRNARPYTVKENGDCVNVAFFALTASEISNPSREKSPSATQHCSLSGRFLGYSLREFGLRRPLEMTCIGNVVSIALTASEISTLSRANADVTYTPDVKYAN